MKIIVAAMALALAFPAAAQTAPAEQPQHQGHQQMQGHAEHAQHQGAQHRDHHQGTQHRDGCCEDRDGDGVMDCCEHMAQATEQRDCCAEGAEQPSARQLGHQND